MAPKRSNLTEVPPAASSSEDDEETSSEGSSAEEEEEEEEEEPQTHSNPLIQKSPPPRKPETLTPVMGNEESESGSESGSESESDMAMPIVKPLASKPMEDMNAKKPRSYKPLASSSLKRPAEIEQDAKDAKRPKKKAGEEGNTTATAVEEVKKTGEDAKKQLFQRLFSEDDEIALLKGMLDYSAKKGADPCADMNAFYDFVKKSIHTDVTKAQLMDKIRRLKKKFENNVGKGKKGEDRTFSKAHEQNAFELSKKIWGKEGISGKVESSAKFNGKAKANNKAVVALKAELYPSPDKKVDAGLPVEMDKKVAKSSGNTLFDKRFGVSSLEEEVLKNGLDMVDCEKKAALEAKWRKLQIAELELFIERSELVKEHARLMLEFYKSEDK